MDSHWHFAPCINPETIQDYAGFIYLVTNKLTNRGYVGRKYLWKKAGDKQKVSDWKRYRSSCKPLLKDIETYGMSAFHFVIISVHETKDETNLAEEMTQRQLDVLRTKLPNGERAYYNGNIGGRKFGTNGSLTEECKAKLSAAKKGKPRSEEAKRKVLEGLQKYLSATKQQRAEKKLERLARRQEQAAKDRQIKAEERAEQRKRIEEQKRIRAEQKRISSELNVAAMRKLSNDQVLLIRERRASGSSIKRLAKEFGIDPKTTRSVTSGLSYKHVGGPLTPVCEPTRPPTRLLDTGDVESIRERRASGETFQSLAKSFGMTVLTIQKITSGATYKDFPGPITTPKPRRRF